MTWSVSWRDGEQYSSSSYLSILGAKGSSYCVHPVWDCLCFLDVSDSFLSLVREFSAVTSSNIFSGSLFLSSPSGTCFMQTLVPLILSLTSLKLSSFLLDHDSLGPTINLSLFRGLKQNLWTLEPRDPTETKTELYLSVSCGGMGQQWTAVGAGPLGASDLCMA